MSDAEKPILTSAEKPSLTDDNVVDPNAAPAGAETPESVPVPDGAEGTPVPNGANPTDNGAAEKSWFPQLFGGKRKSRKQSRKQKGGKKSKSRGGNKKSRKQKRSAKNKRA